MILRRLKSCANKFEITFSRATLKTLSRDRRKSKNMEAQFNYEEAICTLNSLQSNAMAIQSIEERIRRREECVNIKETWKFLSRVGIGVEEMNKLSVIHIAGTKGKGSTSAMCESILRHHRFRTGLYSSPHLVSATERIKVDGKALSKERLAEVFSQVYHHLWEKQEYDGDMPGYFTFLTVMALKVFLQEKVDVAVVEVGIGGEHDVTNVVSNVGAAGITSLGLEHTSILGNTIEQIAREKGGIMKRGCRTFTVPQTPAAMTVLQNIALTRNCTLNVVPELSTYDWESKIEPPLLEFVPSFKLNASLAIQLSHTWMNQYKPITFENGSIFSNMKLLNFINNQNSTLPHKKIEQDENNGREKSEIIKNSNKELIEEFVTAKDVFVTKVPVRTCDGINSCVLPGRCQIFKNEFVDFYIDGAHTLESMCVCTEWFKQLLRPQSIRILIFNTTGDRNSETLLKLLLPLDFHMVLFVPNVAFDDKKLLQCLDQINLTTSKDERLQRCRENLEIWNKLQEEHRQKNLSEKMSKKEAKVLFTVDRAIEYIKSICENNFHKPQVLVTGSLHLVGAALAVLDPDLSISNKRPNSFS